MSILSLFRCLVPATKFPQFSPISSFCTYASLSVNLPSSLQDVFEHFSTSAHLCYSLPPLFGLLVAPSCLSLTGQLTQCCRAFPATRATGKRQHTALFDVPSPVIRYTWAVFCTDFLFNRSTACSLLRPSFLHQFLNGSCSLLLNNMLPCHIDVLDFCRGHKLYSTEAHEAVM